jgi:hypothetical protein
MKKKLLLALMLTLYLHGFSQTVYWSENFGTNTGWTLDQNWSFNGGKLQFYWSPTITNFDLSAVSPEIELHPNTKDLIVNQHLNAYGSSNPPEAAEIILVTADEEVVLWDFYLNFGNWGNSTGSDIFFDLSHYAGQTVQFKFRTYGPTTFQWNWWDVFDLKLTAMFQNDLAAVNIEGPSAVNIDETAVWSVQVKNLGLMPQSTFSVSLYSHKFNELIGNYDVYQTLEPGATLALDVSWTAYEAYNTAFYALVELDGDEFATNNTSKSHFVRVHPNIQYSVLLWDNDNGIQTIIDPESGDMITSGTALKRALDNTGISYHYVNSLPAFIDGYDIIFATMGCYCLS